jgi:hypothetical protein
MSDTTSAWIIYGGLALVILLVRILSARQR